MYGESGDRMTIEDIHAIYNQAVRASNNDRLVKLDPDDCLALCNMAESWVKFKDEQDNSRGNW